RGARGPALTALVMLFLPDDQVAEDLTPILRAEYETKLLPLPPWMGGSGPVLRLLKRIGWRLFRDKLVVLGHSVLRPHDLRRNAAIQYLREYRRACSEWVKEHLPGAFTLGLADRELPGAQLLITEVAE